MDLEKDPNPDLVSGLLLLALFGSSLEPILVKYFSYSIDPVALMGLKSFFGGLVFLPFLKNLKRISRNNLPSLIYISFLAFITNVFIFLAIKSIPASILITIIASTPAVVGIINYYRKTVAIDITFIFGFVSVMIGIILTVNSMLFRPEPWAISGLVFAFISVVTSSAYRLKMDQLTQAVNPILISTFLFTFNGFISLPILTLYEIPNKIWPFAIWLGISGVIANIAFLFAIKHLGSTRVSILSVLQRPMAVILGAIILYEVVTIDQIIGMILIFVGAYFAKANKIQNSNNVPLIKTEKL